MKYLLMIYAAESAWEAQSDQEEQARMDRYETLTNEMRANGVLLAGQRLVNVESATSVRVREGQALISDGPFAETKEQLGGFYLLDCKDLDEAVAYAKQIPSAELGTIEIRPLYYQD